MSMLSVLVVEDDAVIGLLLAETLEDLGHEVCAIAATEDDAVTKAARFKPGLMIVDVNLQEGSGVTAMDRILAAGPMPCVFMTAAPEKVDRPNAKVLRKPFAEHHLVMAIEQVLGPTIIPPVHHGTTPGIIHRD